MLNQVKDFISGIVLDVVLAAAAESGDLVEAGDYAGVALNGGAIGDTVAVHTEGVFQLASTAGSSAVTQGEKIYWDGSAQEVKDTNAGSDILIGRAYESSAMGGAVVLVKLENPVA